MPVRLEGKLPADAYLAVNLLRNGKLSVHISELATGDSLVSALKEKVQSKTATDIFHHTFDYVESPDYRKLLQEALDKGLEVFKDTENQNNWENIWGIDAGANLAYLLGANSTTVGCAIGQCTKETTAPNTGRTSNATPTGKAVLFCELSPPAEKEKAPFDEEYYNGLISRTAKLADMTEEDLKAPSNGDTAAAAFPTILTAGLVAILASVAA
ncbi:SAG family member [Eimeria brunetti]|uniref:SAG family member n=1 Tax=Eimeria brunetti TaxID=51314 RepID=U6L5E0_9EIME|nr:SAG family member [Eimeria brunetti]